MILGEVFQRFVSKSPISVMARGLMERAFNPQRLDEWFEATAESQYMLAAVSVCTRNRGEVYQ